MTKPSEKFDHGTYDASHFSEKAVDGKVTKEDIQKVFNKLSESKYWIPNVIPASDATHLLTLFGVMFFVTFLMFFLGVWTQALFFKDIVFFPFILGMVYFATYVLVKAKRSSYEDEYHSDRQTQFMEILMRLNQTEFRSRGFRFEAGEKGAWIELHLARPIEALGQHNFNLIDKVKKEVNETLADEFYLAGLVPFGVTSWKDFK